MSHPQPTRGPKGHPSRLVLAVLLGAFSTSGFGLESPPASLPDGRKIYLKNCAPCHGEDGRARTPAARKLGVKDLTQNRLEDDKIRTQILEGVQVPGTTAKMPAFHGKLSEAEIQALIAVVKRFRKP